MMAKKTTKAASTRKPAPQSPGPTNAINLAATVASRVQIQDVFAEEFRARRSPGVGGTQLGDVAIQIDRLEVSRPADSDEIIVRVKFVLRVGEGEPSVEPPSIEMECGFVLAYSLTSLDDLTDEALLAFGRTSGVFNAWPYWREFVQSTSLRLSIPPIIIPTYRPPPR